VCLGGVGRSNQVFRLVVVLAERKWFHREWLGRRSPFAGNVGLRNRPFFDTKNRLTGDPIENEHQSEFSCLCQGGNFLTFDRHIEQNRRRRQIHIPQVMMHGLEIPLELARHCVERDD